ncbi:MAG: hypothetical protein IIW14_05630 [Kiritimatiellae bacterium]|nr:hypothetical protein [Kiritimatiellia bacterium]
MNLEDLLIVLDIGNEALAHIDLIFRFIGADKAFERDVHPFFIESSDPAALHRGPFGEDRAADGAEFFSFKLAYHVAIPAN